ncbi:MAG: branched-chain amino acid ABC transporter permease [Candidatus Rokuibacteriota bacterium]|nr:MAG: branched-chain amino acid ABC transporter permease [Candidatus Rokubacteria bacterium]PYN28302.1 MAG: branched-chain amino acid ABC transporter permease [Candidatus Rokubacteria bacterium]
MRGLAQAVTSGLLIGAVYGLIALGLNIVFGTMRVVNFAQGTLLMAGMFMTYWLWELGGVHPYISPLVTAPLLFGLGFAVQHLFVSPLLARERAREPMSVLLLTLGLALVLENVALLFFSADFKTVTTDVSMQTFKIAGLIVSVPRLVGLGAMVATSLVLYLFFMHTDLGRAVRATGQDREVARLMGINDFRIYGVAYGLSAAMMGIAAAVLVPFFYIHPGVGTSFLLKAFVIVVLGGLGSMPGAALGGLLVGVIEGAVALWVQAAVAQIVLFAVFVAILFVRPAGLLGVERR